MRLIIGVSHEHEKLLGSLKKVEVERDLESQLVLAASESRGPRGVGRDFRGSVPWSIPRSPTRLQLHLMHFNKDDMSHHL